MQVTCVKNLTIIVWKVLSCTMVEECYVWHLRGESTSKLVIMKTRAWEPILLVRCAYWSLMAQSPFLATPLWHTKTTTPGSRVIPSQFDLVNEQPNLEKSVALLGWLILWLRGVCSITQFVWTCPSNLLIYGAWTMSCAELRFKAAGISSQLGTHLCGEHLFHLMDCSGWDGDWRVGKHHELREANQHVWLLWQVLSVSKVHKSLKTWRILPSCASKVVYLYVTNPLLFKYDKF